MCMSDGERRSLIGHKFKSGNIFIVGEGRVLRPSIARESVDLLKGKRAMAKEKYLLSICIPSYNRFDKLEDHLRSIFQAQSKEFEVVVIDNGSTKDIKKEMTFCHPRLRIIKRTIPVCGQQSILESVTFANAKFALILLDKDNIIGKGLDAFINIIKGIPDLYGGYARPHHDSNEASNRILLYKHGKLKKFGYREFHPSGIFIRTDCVQCAWEKFLPEESRLPYSDLYLVEAAIQGGRMMEYDQPMILMETLAESLKVKSYTYSGEKHNNVWFTPHEQIPVFIIYCRHLLRLPCSKFVKYNVLMSLYRRFVIMVTIDYRNSMNNYGICQHYHIVPRKISFTEMCH